MRQIPTLALLASVLACSTTPSSTPFGRSRIDLSGTYAGIYRASNAPDAIYDSVVRLTQRGSMIRGTLTSNSGRSATVVGSVTGTLLSVTFSFSDDCRGSAISTADIVQDGVMLSGDYRAVDCRGAYDGAFMLTRRR